MKIGVIGNEACDADSIVSAIVYAKFLTTTTNGNAIPFVHCSLDELPDRLDFAEILSIVGGLHLCSNLRSIQNEVSDIDSWILVDHHYPSNLFLSRVRPDFKISHVIDHHRVVTEEARIFLNATPHDIREVGSTCSLIAEKVLFASTDKWLLDKEFLFMLLLVIVLDTGNLNVDLKIATDLDMEMHAKLSCMLGIDPRDQTHWKRLVNSRFNPDYWSKVSVEKMLGYDFKEIDGIGYSTIFVSIDRISDMQIASYAQLKNFNLFIVIGAHLSSECSDFPNRQLIVYSHHQSQTLSLSALHETLMKKYSLRLLFSNESVLRYDVLEKGFSRKKFSPFFSQIVRSNFSS